MALFRVDFQGTLHGAETFQHGHHVDSSDSSSGIASDAAAQWLIILAVAGFNSLFHTGIQWSQVNVSELGATPAAPIVTSAQVSITDGGTDTDPSLPNQCSPCISIQTATAGARARGRMYLPPPTQSALSATGRLSSAAQTAIADNIEDYFDAMTAQAHALVVVSSVGGVYTARPAINIRLGDVFDTQRTRRNSLGEVYASRTV